MVDLAARAAWHGLDLPLSLRGVTLAAAPNGVLVSIAPFAGREAEVSAALGVALQVGEVADLPGGRLIWTGLEQWLLQGVAPPLGESAAVTDQSDAWEGLRLTGAPAAAVLARLVPNDLHPTALPSGRVARTMLGHLMAVLIATPDGYDILVMRSFTDTAVHDLCTAMRSVAAIPATTSRSIENIP